MRGSALSHWAPALWASRVVSSLAYRHGWFMRSLRSARDASPGGRTARIAGHWAPALWASRVVSSLAYRHGWFMRSLRSARDASPGGRTARTAGRWAPALWASLPEDVRSPNSTEPGGNPSTN